MLGALLRPRGRTPAAIADHGLPGGIPRPIRADDSAVEVEEDALDGETHEIRPKSTCAAIPMATVATRATNQTVVTAGDREGVPFGVPYIGTTIRR